MMRLTFRLARVTGGRATLAAALARACTALAFVGWLSACEPSRPSEDTEASVQRPIVSERPEPVTAPVADIPDPSALSEIIAQIPEQPASEPRGKTLVGSETGEPLADEAPASSGEAEGPDEPRVRAGLAAFRPALSSPAIERAARAQLYWRLRACRMADGEPPPPESITLGFTIRQDGSVDPASVTAGAEDEALAEVVVCVLRTFSASPFIGPAAGLEGSSRVLIAWPSVD